MVRRWVPTFLITASALPAIAAPAAKSHPRVNFVFSGAGWPPFVQNENGQATGIIPGILQLATLKFAYDFTSEYKGLDVPNRAGFDAVSQNRTRLNCSGPTSLAWISPADRDAILISEPIFETTDELWFPKGQLPKPRTIAELTGLKLGACTGYSYGNLERQFQNGSLTRVDVQGDQTSTCEERVLESVRTGKVSGGIVNRHVFGYLAKRGLIKKGDFEQFPRPLYLVQLRVLCSKSKAGEEFLKKLDQTLAALKGQNLINDIVKSFIEL